MTAPAATHDDTIAEPGAEQALIGCLLHLPAGPAYELAFRLQPEDLTQPHLRLVLEAIRSLALDQVAPDPIVVLGELRRTGTATSFAGDLGPAPVLAELYDTPPSVGSVGHYLRIVLEHSWRRRVQEAGARLQQAAGVSALVDLEQVVASEYVALREWSRRWRDEQGPPAVVPLQQVAS